MDEESADYGDFDQDDLMEDTEALRTEKVTQPQMDIAPSENEIRLGRKVHQLEAERDALAAELAELKSRYPNHSSTIPVPTTNASSGPSQLTIPHELLPTLALLRSHIHHLTRDNEALRYTFMGVPSVSSPNPAGAAVPAVATSSKVTLDVTMSPGPSVSTHLTPTATLSEKASPAVERTSAESEGGNLVLGGIDLETIVRRVRELIKENEELGEMVVEAGRSGSAEWQAALDESKAVITSLDSDLSHHLSVVQSVHKELEAYKSRFGPLPQHGSASGSATPTTSVTGSISRKSDSSNRNRTGHSRTQSHSHSHSRREDTREPRGQGKYEERDKAKDLDRDKDLRLGDGSSRRGYDRSEGRGGGGGSGAGRGVNGGRDAKREEDRAWKRRR